MSAYSRTKAPAGEALIPWPEKSAELRAIRLLCAIGARQWWQDGQWVVGIPEGQWSEASRAALGLLEELAGKPALRIVIERQEDGSEENANRFDDGDAGRVRRARRQHGTIVPDRDLYQAQ